VEIVFHSSRLAIVELVGEHDLAQLDRVRDALETAQTQRPDVVVDLSRCEFFDSSVISALLHAQDEIGAAGGRLALIIPDASPHLSRIVNVMQLGELLPLHGSLEAALAALEHATRVCDRRTRRAGPDLFQAECSCGWRGDLQTGICAMRLALADANAHAATCSLSAEAR
jgi:anti-anti-sigma factor